MGIRVHVMDSASYDRRGWHDLYGGAVDALNGNIARVFITNIPQSIKTAGYVQDTNYCCGPSSIANALGMANDAEPHAWLESRGLMTSAWGTEYSGIVRYLNAKGYSCSYDGRAHDGEMSGSFYNEIINCLKSGYKVILCMHHPRTNYWTNGGHYITLDAISGVGEAAKKKSSASKTTTSNSGAKIAEDGKWGCGTTKKAQRVFGCAVVDGIVSNQNEGMRKHLPNCQPASWEFVAQGKLKNGSGLVKKIQKMLGIKQDGFFGVQTIKALQKFLGVKVDGYFGGESVKAFQKWLNKQ